MTKETCRSEVELEMLVPGMAKQHENYQDALQELIDNSVSSIVKDEQYFEEAHDRVEIAISLIRDKNTVRTVVADNGPGIKREHLRDEIFRTGNKNVSEGILNNVGWGLKASISWFEQTLKQDNIWEDKKVEQSSKRETLPPEYCFKLVTKRENANINQVKGPVTGDLPLTEGDEQIWAEGADINEHSLAELNHGTRVHVHCSRSQFDADVWPSADSLAVKAQALRERLGVKFRRLLKAREDNKISIYYHDQETGEEGTLPVIPISPIYADKEGEDSEYAYDEFEVEDEEGNIFNVEFERGTLDFDAMTGQIEDEHPEMLTGSGRFRTRYRPSQTKQGIDIYANGRVLMTSVFSDLFDLARNNEYNYFGGTLRIIPHDPSVEVPTDNKKTRIDTNSKLWAQLQQKLSQEEYQPQGKDYHSKSDTSASESVKQSQQSKESVSSADSNKETSHPNPSTDIDSIDDIFGLHQKDARKLDAVFKGADIDPEKGGFIDTTITSPPYFDLKDYGYEDEDQIGRKSSYHAYLDQLREIFSNIYKYTKDSGTLWVVVNTFKQGDGLVQLPADVAHVAQNLPGYDTCPNCSTEDLEIPLRPNRKTGELLCPNCGYSVDPSDDSWTLQEIVIWDKQRALPYSQAGKFRNVFEYILGFSKTDSFKFDLDDIRIADPSQFEQWWVDYPERYHPRGKVPENIWQFTTPSQGAFGELSSELDHPAPFPPDLVERLLNLTTDEGDIVLDPFAGSGMVLAQAEAMNRRPIGFELNPEYIQSYGSIKDKVSDIWDSGESSSSIKKRQKDLGYIIGCLRQIKQTRELLRVAADEQNIDGPAALDVDAVFSITEYLDEEVTNTNSFMDASIVAVVGESVTPRRGAQLESLFSKLLDNSCSGYGIHPSVSVMRAETLLTAVNDGEFPEVSDNLFVYEDGDHYQYENKISFMDWCEKAVETNEWQKQYRHEIPPIISNIELEVHNPRRESTNNTSKNNRDLDMHKARIHGLDGKHPVSWVSAAPHHAD